MTGAIILVGQRRIFRAGVSRSGEEIGTIQPGICLPQHARLVHSYPRLSLQAMDTGIGTANLYTASRVTGQFLYAPSNKRYGVSGTGFIATLADDRAVLVTNRHIVDHVWAEPSKAGSVLERLDVTVWRDNATTQELSLSPHAISVHPDPTIDVAAAIIDAASTVITASPQNVVIGYNIPWFYLHDRYQQYANLLEAGEPVMFPGYPEWFDHLAGRPIMRTGAIVSDPQFDYRYTDGPPDNADGNRQIAFDAFSFSGNSGSPVFVALRGLETKAAGGFTLTYDGTFHPSLLIGINAGHLSDRTGQHAGLSRMFKTSAIIELLQTL